MKHLPYLAAVLASSIAFACGSSPAPDGEPLGDAVPSAPAGGGGALPAPASPPSEPPPSKAPSSRERCGAAPYDWVTSAALGDVLESEGKASHTPLELNYVLLEAKNQNQFKTRRIARYSTKSRLVRYQTQDRGKLVDATTMMAYPNVDSPKTFPILLVLHGTAGFNDACSPSKGIADDALGGFANETGLLLSLFASFGYVVVAPDYIGLKSLGAPTGFMHPYLVAEPTAIASLDAVRAAKKALSGGAVTPSDVIVMGGSQGGHAAAFVNRYQPHYAPEITIKGSVWDVPPTDLIGHAKPALTSWRKATANMIAATTTFDSWYRASSTGVSAALLPPYDTLVPNTLISTCDPSADTFAGATRETVFTPAYLTAGAQPGFGAFAPWACYFTENSLPTTSVPKLDSIPSLMLLGEDDDLVDNVVERASFETLCGQGYVLSFLECSGASHTKALLYGFDQWLDFLEARLSGAPLSGTCAIRPPEPCTSAPSP